ncbi:MAG: tetratricopeptide repeat protein [Nitrospinae bacterium]|nr:tetratricopeptide repeat protein [Nitrospinota bacterium]
MESTNKEIFLTPFAQQIVRQYSPKLELLLRKFPNIAFSFHDNGFSQSFAKIFMKMGFKVHSVASQSTGTLSKHLPLWLESDRFVLLHYRPVAGNMNLIHLLRAIKSNKPKLSFRNFVPVFFASYSSEKQMEVFRILGAFGITYAIFLSPKVSLDTNIAELMKGLEGYIESKTRKPKPPENFPGSTQAESNEKSNKLEEFELLNSKGEELMKKGDMNQAITLFTRAIEMKPDYQSLLNRGDAYYKMERYPEALIDYQQASRVEKIVPDPYANMSACCFNLVKKSMKNGDKVSAKKWAEKGMLSMHQAKEKVQELIEKKADSPEGAPHNPYERIIKALGETDIRGLGMEEAEQELSQLTTEAVKASGEIDFMDSGMEIENRINYAILLTRTDDFDKAEAIFRQIIRDDPSNVGPAFNNFAVELRKKGQNGKSFEIYSELLDSKGVPDRDIIVENLKTAGLKYAMNLRDDFKTDEALKVYKTILAHKPKEIEWVLCELASAYNEIPDEKQASLRILEAIQINKDIVLDDRFKQYDSLKRLIQKTIITLSEVT